MTNGTEVAAWLSSVTIVCGVIYRFIVLPLNKRMDAWDKKFDKHAEKMEEIWHDANLRITLLEHDHEECKRVK